MFPVRSRSFSLSLCQPYALYCVFRRNERFRVYIIAAPIELEPVDFGAQFVTRMKVIL
jgi:hypothetical protein